MALELQATSPAYLDLERWSPAGCGSYEQVTTAEGGIRIANTYWEISAPAIRSHDWGPGSERDASLSLNGAIGNNFVFATHLDTSHEVAGFVWDGTVLHPLAHAAVRTDWSAAPRRPHNIRLSLVAGATTWELSGQLRALLATPAKPGGAEMDHLDGLVRWSIEGGRVGHGTAHYDHRVLAI